MKLFILLAIGLLASSVSRADSLTPPAKGNVAGAYWGQVDVGAFGTPRIETFGVYLDNNGGIVSMGEHEEDKESAGIGVWEHIPGGMVGIGVASFRYGPDPASSVCALVGATSPPENCILKLGGTLSPQQDGTLVGDVALTIETVDGAIVFSFPFALPTTFERMKLEDFPDPP